MGDVVELHVPTLLDVPPEKVLRGAIEANLASVVVMGTGVNGERFFASSQVDAAETLWLLQRAVHRLMQLVDNED